MNRSALRHALVFVLLATLAVAVVWAAELAGTNGTFKTT